MQRSASQRGRPDRLVGQAKTVCRQQTAVHKKGRVRLVRRNRPVCFAFQEVTFLKGLLKAPAKSDYFLAFLRLVFLFVDFLAFLRVAFFLVLFLAFLRVAFFLVLFLAFLRVAFFFVDFLAAFLRVAFFFGDFLAFLRVAFFFVTIALWLLP